MEAAYLIPISAVQAFPAPAREAIHAYFGLLSAGAAAPKPSAAAAAAAGQPEDEEPVELTLALVRKLTRKPINPKTLAVLRWIAGRPSPAFRLGDLIAAVDGVETYLDLRGVWSGLTRRTRDILGDSDVDLIWWDYDPDADDHVGTVAKLTHDSLHAYFG